MEHVVFYPSAEGGPAFKRVNSLDEAVAFVEHLRNSENITDFSVHELTAVPLSFRAYYHVEVPAEEAVSESAALADATPEPVVEEPAAAPVAEVEAAPAVEQAPAVEKAVTDAAVVNALVATSAPETVAVPAQAEAPELSEAPEASPSDDITVAPVEAVDEDRSEAWVAEAAVVEPPAEAPESAPVEEPVVAAGPFAEAPPVTPQGTEDVVPVPTGKRSMGFFAR
jgi:hypothetical protein